MLKIKEWLVRKTDHVFEHVKMPDSFFPINVFINRADGPRIYARPHWHDEVEILFVKEGRAIQQVNGQVFGINTGDIVIIGGGSVHSTRTEHDGRTDILVVQLGHDFANPAEIIPEEGKDILEFIKCSDFPNPIKSSEEPGRRMMQYLEDIHLEWQGNARCRELLIRSSVYRFIGTALRELVSCSDGADRKKEDKRAKEMLRNAFSLIEANYSKRLTLKDAANASNLSVPHFCRLFRRYTGIGFMEYIGRYRIGVAEKKLGNGMNVTETAYECGFNDVSTFIRTFRKYRGITPGKAYRK
jgi:AraC family transcriptional activator of pobA